MPHWFVLRTVILLQNYDVIKKINIYVVMMVVASAAAKNMFSYLCLTLSFCLWLAIPLSYSQAEVYMYRCSQTSTWYGCAARANMKRNFSYLMCVFKNIKTRLNFFWKISSSSLSLLAVADDDVERWFNGFLYLCVIMKMNFNLGEKHRQIS